MLKAICEPFMLLIISQEEASNKHTAVLITAEQQEAFTTQFSIWLEDWAGAPHDPSLVQHQGEDGRGGSEPLSWLWNALWAYFISDTKSP